MTTSTTTLFRSYIVEEYSLTEEPYYVPVGDEIELFEAAYHSKIPVLFKGPDGMREDALRRVHVLPDGQAPDQG